MNEVEIKDRLRELAEALKLYAGDSEQIILDQCDPNFIAALDFLKELPKPKPQDHGLRSSPTRQPSQKLTSQPAQSVSQPASTSVQAAKMQGAATAPIEATETLKNPDRPTNLNPMEAKSLDSLHLRIKNCMDCGLGHSRTTMVFGQGNQTADLVFIGEGPTTEEDKTGNIYASPAGKLLNQIITSIGVSRESVYYCNVVKCKASSERSPLKEEINSCAGFLGKQIALLKPKLIVTLGNVATKALIPEADAISKIRGKVQNYNGIQVIPTFHPNYLLHTHSHLTQMWDDMRVIRQKLFVELVAQ